MVMCIFFYVGVEVVNLELLYVKERVLYLNYEINVVYFEL